MSPEAHLKAASIAWSQLWKWAFSSTTVNADLSLVQTKMLRMRHVQFLPRWPKLLFLLILAMQEVTPHPISWPIRKWSPIAASSSFFFFLIRGATFPYGKKHDDIYLFNFHLLYFFFPMRTSSHHLCPTDQGEKENYLGTKSAKKAPPTTPKKANMQGKV